MIKIDNKSFFHLGIRQKVLLTLIFVLLASLTFSGWFGFQNAKKNIAQEVQLRGINITRFMSKSLVYSVVGYDYHTIGLFLREITNTDGVGYSKVVNAKGNTMGETGTLIINDPMIMVPFSQDLKLDGEVVGKVTVGLSTARIYKRLESQKFALIKREVFIILLIAIGEFVVLSFIIIKPVCMISESLKNVRNEDGIRLGTIPITSNDEIGELAKQFNQLSDELNEANRELQSRVDYADKQLIKTNNLLLERSKELLTLNNEFKNLSLTDSLTGLYNRRHFKDVMHSELEISKRHGDINSLIIIDIDYFKKINDKYGHTQGDAVIQATAEIMKTRLRETDVLCRIGGEEFVAICKRADRESSIKLAENLRKSVEEKKFSIGDDSVNVTISIGISTVVPQKIDVTSEIWFKNADIALYYSKDNGRNRISHYDDIEMKNFG